jgi:hypothetical protein
MWVLNRIGEERLFNYSIVCLARSKVSGFQIDGPTSLLCQKRKVKFKAVNLLRRYFAANRDKIQGND